MREIVFDTETTGLDPASGHRVVEIGCVELINHIPTGETRQWYINPERDMPEEAYQVHGLSEDFLGDKPVFAEVAGDFMAYIDGATLVAHNAGFDARFINAELAALDRPNLPAERLVDTIAMARQKIPGAQYSLDALCRRFGIDLSRRDKHGALLDAELLAEVYLELIGGRQPGLVLAADAAAARVVAAERPMRPPRPHAPTAEEGEAHRAFIATLDDPIWDR
ncbi:MAG: DNA polymerase III subunit epsilon [Alphaproteobacteria bacterium]|jgi:DNA polymerase-3 subunit epsilon|nr:DNA polymerase III subunit epsilon [Alphaproteobacteria bacterium]MDP6815066.1 DNA polymerase III subunit epsilon [Alphaproteobacteria bacterium]